jgi:hypothetical protein
MQLAKPSVDMANNFNSSFVVSGGAQMPCFERDGVSDVPFQLALNA